MTVHTPARDLGDAGRYWLGVYNPSGYTVGVVDEPGEARGCVTDLVDAGIAASDVELITGEEALSAHRRQRAAQGPLVRFLGAVLTDEHSAQEDYLAAAGEGASLVVFRARSDALERRGRRVLAAHHARLVRHYGRWTWEEAS